MSLTRLPPQIDYFSLLPNELVQLIADHHDHKFGQDPIPLVSKRFLPHHRAQLYSAVNISTPFQLDAFFETLSTVPHLGTLVGSLHLMMPLPETDSEGDDQTSLARFDDDTLQGCLKTLTRVSYCNIDQSSRISRLVLGMEEPMSIELINLYIKLSGNDFPDLFDPYNFRHLSKYPSLADLSVITVEEPTFVNLANRSNQSFPNLTSIDSLSIDGKLSDTYPSHLIGCCTPISFPVSNWDSGDGVTAALKAVKSPSLVQELILRTRNRLPAPSYLDHLRKYDNIRSLNLGRGCVPFEPAFYRYLRSLPLEDLTFGYEARLSSTGVLSLVEGSSRIKTLGQLQLDHIIARKGSFAASHWNTDWILPNWEGEVTRSQCEAIRGAGERVGVEVIGKVFEAMEIEDTFERVLAKNYKRERERLT